MLLGPGGGVQRCVAGTGFPTAPTDGTTFSIGVVQIVVDPSFAFLFAPAPTYAYYYPGYAGPTSGILTGPVMYDRNTVIGESTNNSISATVFPVSAGTPDALSAQHDLQQYSGIYRLCLDSAAIFSWRWMPARLTTKSLRRSSKWTWWAMCDTNGSSCSDPRVPTHTEGSTGQGAGPQVTVQAGPGGMGIGSSLPLNRRSIGIVQQTTWGCSDFPAQSFFDVFVEVTLPQVPYTIVRF